MVRSGAGKIENSISAVDCVVSVYLRKVVESEPKAVLCWNDRVKARNAVATLMLKVRARKKPRFAFSAAHGETETKMSLTISFS